MNYFLNCRSLIRVAVIIVVMAFMASQMMDTDAGRRGNRGGTTGGDQNSGWSVDCNDIKAKLHKIINKIDVNCDDGDCPDNGDCPDPGECPGAVPKTGQTTLYAFEGDDGDLQKGVAWPVPRFTDNGDGTITDNLTCLIWDRNANRFGNENTWLEALSLCNNLADDGNVITDGSVAGDWRLPNALELISLAHWEFADPALPDTAGTGQWSDGDPFFDVPTGNVPRSAYWSSNTVAVNASWAKKVGFELVETFDDIKQNPIQDTSYVWCVRDE